MGSLAARDMAVHADRGTAVAWHLSHNHYPPVPRCMVAPALMALECLEEAPGTNIPLPEGVTFRDGRTAVTAEELASSLHLWDLL